MKYFLYDSFRDKVSFFWVFLYPILLSTIIFLSFNNNEDFKINLAVENNPTILEAGKFLPFLNLVESKDPDKDLKENKIDGFVDSKGNLEIKNSGIKENILIDFLSDIERFKTDPEAAIDVMSKINFEKDTEEQSMYSFYFSLLAMVSFYGSMQVLNYRRYFDLNRSETARRISVSGFSTTKLSLYAYLINVILSIISLVLPILWVKYVLNFNPIINLKATLLILLIANIFSSSVGLFAMYIKGNLATVNGILVTLMLILSFAAGLSGPAFTSIIIQNAPWLYNYNPIAIITKELSLVNSGYGSDSLIRNMIILGLLSLIFISFALVMASIRRRRQNVN